jgi:hypothetical protein
MISNEKFMGYNVVLCLYDSRDFNIKLKNAPFNRPPDELRITEIMETYKERQTFVDGVIHVYRRGDEHICYDGIHRITAIMRLAADGIYRRFIYEVLDAPEEAAKIRFTNINNRVEVPDIFVSYNTDTDVYMEVYMEVFNRFFTDKYKSHLSASMRCQHPNINRDVFLNQIKEYKGTVDEILAILYENNEKIKQKIEAKPSLITAKQLQKCRNTGLYLFAL